MFQILNYFWVAQLPFFSDFQIMYYVMDLLTVITFFRLLFSMCELVFPTSRRY